jgi:hypothetical protein
MVAQENSVRGWARGVGPIIYHAWLNYKGPFGLYQEQQNKSADGVFVFIDKYYLFV